MSYTPLSNVKTTSRSSRSPSKRLRWNRTKCTYNIHSKQSYTHTQTFNTVRDRFLTTDYWRDESLHREDSGSDVELDELAESLGPATLSNKHKANRSHLLSQLWKKCQTVTLLFLLGVFVAVITFTMDKTVSSLEHAKLSILLTSENVTKTNEKTTFGSTLLYLIVSLILAVIALGLVRSVVNQNVNRINMRTRNRYASFRWQLDRVFLV